MSACPRCNVFDKYRSPPICTRPDCPAVEAAVTRHHFDIIEECRLARMKEYEDDFWDKANARAERLRRYEEHQRVMLLNLYGGLTFLAVVGALLWWWLA